MNILITGATGFVGKNLLRIIDKVRNTIIVPTKKNISIVGCKCIPCENYVIPKAAFYENGIYHIDIVVHLGARTPRTVEEYSATAVFLDNIATTQLLIDNLPSIPNKFIYISSVDVYKYDGVPICENSDLQTRFSYGLSKLLCEKIICEGLQTKCKIDILRLGNVYGPGDEVYHKLIGDFIVAALKNDDINVYSNGSEFRNYIYVEDACETIIKCISKEEAVGLVNVVGDSNITLKELISIIVDASHSKSKIIYGNKTGVIKSFDSSLYISVFGRNKYDYYKGIFNMIDYYKKLIEI